MSIWRSWPSVRFLQRVETDWFKLLILTGLTNKQFQDAMSLAESLDFMSRAQYYRKYRPAFTEHKGHYKEWWKFAYRCIVEEDVRRRQLNWDWQHIKKHRQLVKVYADVSDSPLGLIQTQYFIQKSPTRSTTRNWRVKTSNLTSLPKSFSVRRLWMSLTLH